MSMKKLKNISTGRLETYDDLDEAVAKITDPDKGKTKIKRKYLKKEVKTEEEE
jgi:hypothetical protein